jgi:hypothetical protein
MSSWHHGQTNRNSCVPACMCIIQKWRGQPPTEAVFHAGSASRGHALTRVLEMGSARYAQLGLDEEDELKVHLFEGGLIVAGVFGVYYADWQRRAYLGWRQALESSARPGDIRHPCTPLSS